MRTKAKEPIMNAPSLFENVGSSYQPVPALNFNPYKIIITKGSYQTQQQRDLVKAICNAYPKAEIIEKLNKPHNL